MASTTRRWLVLVAAAALSLGFFLLWKHQYSGLDVWQAPRVLSETQRETQQALLAVITDVNERVVTLSALILGAFGFIVTKKRPSTTSIPELLLGLLSLALVTSSLVSGLILYRHVAFMLKEQLAAFDNPHLFNIFEQQLLCLIAGAAVFVLYATASMYSEHDQTGGNPQSSGGAAVSQTGETAPPKPQAPTKAT